MNLETGDCSENEQSALGPPPASKPDQKKVSEYEHSVLEAKKSRKFADKRYLEYLASRRLR